MTGHLMLPIPKCDVKVSFQFSLEQQHFEKVHMRPESLFNTYSAVNKHTVEVFPFYFFQRSVGFKGFHKGSGLKIIYSSLCQ